MPRNTMTEKGEPASDRPEEYHPLLLDLERSRPVDSQQHALYRGATESSVLSLLCTTDKSRGARRPYVGVLQPVDLDGS